jgi:hypothetical protein
MRPHTWGVLAVVVATVVAWRVRGHVPARDDARVADGGDLDSLLVDRLWIDHLPRGERDVFNVFFVISEQPIGVFQAASVWQGRYELFQYEAQGKRKLTIEYPHTGDRDSVRATATRCDEGGMDYCLELAGASRGVKRYYSQEDWGANTVLDAERLVDVLAHHAAPADVRR